MTPFVILGACGSDDAIPRDVSNRLTQQVDAIEQSATAGDYPEARQRASDLRAQVDTLREQGVLDETAAQRVGRALTMVESELSTSTGTTTTTTTAPLPVTTAAPRATTPPTTRAPVPTPTKKAKGNDKKDE
jgi:hypothetical protein